MNRIIRYLSQKIISFLGLNPLNKIEKNSTAYYNTARNIEIDNYLRDYLFSRVKYTEGKRLNKFEFNIYSQNGEDGIIEEIFKRIGYSNRVFVEFGVHGVKNNTTYLMHKQWKGLWIEGSNEGVQIVRKVFGQEIKSKKLRVIHAYIKPENIDELLLQGEVPTSFDYLSIDIDGNDYWIWNAIKNFKPRVVQIEYNATLRYTEQLVMEYNENHVWDGSSYFGASLRALEKLGKRKGYSLIACDFSGCNAFFISNDEDLGKFESPFTAENHYEPPRYFLQRNSGHRMGYGSFVQPE